jgi:hypothetical protein
MKTKKTTTVLIPLALAIFTVAVYAAGSRVTLVTPIDVTVSGTGSCGPPERLQLEGELRTFIEFVERETFVVSDNQVNPGDLNITGRQTGETFRPSGGFSKRSGASLLNGGGTDTFSGKLTIVAERQGVPLRFSIQFTAHVVYRFFRPSAVTFDNFKVVCP